MRNDLVAQVSAHTSLCRCWACQPKVICSTRGDYVRVPCAPRPSSLSTGERGGPQADKGGRPFGKLKCNSKQPVMDDRVNSQPSPQATSGKTAFPPRSAYGRIRQLPLPATTRQPLLHFVLTTRQFLGLPASASLRSPATPLRLFHAA